MSAPKAVFVLVHGGWHNHSTWDKITPILEANGFTAWTLDLPGAGANAIAPTSLGRRPFDAEREADWIASAIDLAAVDVVLSGARGFQELDASGVIGRSLLEPRAHFAKPAEVGKTGFGGGETRFRWRTVGNRRGESGAHGVGEGFFLLSARLGKGRQDAPNDGAHNA